MNTLPWGDSAAAGLETKLAESLPLRSALVVGDNPLRVIRAANPGTRVAVATVLLAYPEYHQICRDRAQDLLTGLSQKDESDGLAKLLRGRLNIERRSALGVAGRTRLPLVCGLAPKPAASAAATTPPPAKRQRTLEGADFEEALKRQALVESMLPRCKSGCGVRLAAFGLSPCDHTFCAQCLIEGCTLTAFFRNRCPSCGEVFVSALRLEPEPAT